MINIVLNSLKSFSHNVKNKRIMYIFTTLKFPTQKFDFHLLTTSVNAKYYYIENVIFRTLHIVQCLLKNRV